MSECRFRWVITRLFDHFVTPFYKMTFEQDPPCTSKATMDAPIDIAYWYASPSHTFIRMLNAEKPLHVLLKFALDILIMQEVTYTSRQDWQLDCTRRRRHLGPRFHCGLGYMTSKVSTKWMSKQNRWRSTHSTSKVTICMTHIVLWKITAWEYSSTGYMGHVIGQRRTHGDIVTTPPDSMN